ncbi:MAG: hypothetical protein LQ351_006619 [Letrouitia transgressa]|nr:MAG: hypothetical protein LQ351_006619 [Letrouitia transgressa]
MAEAIPAKQDNFRSMDPAGAISPLARTCGPSSAKVVCINHYASVIPYHFSRNALAYNVEHSEDSFRTTTVSNDTSFELVRDADFLVFDQARGLALLGDNPTNDFLFTVSLHYHEAPVYAPKQNKLLFSQITPSGFLPQYSIDLGEDPLTISEYATNPPLYAANGATFHDGYVYWAVSGGNNSIFDPPREQRPGIYRTEPGTGKTECILNNYFGYYLNSPNDIIVDRNGHVWFTDPDYGWFSGLTDTAPQQSPATYRFNPNTGALNVVEQTLELPNGIGFSPDGKTLYISDSGSASSTILQKYGSIAATFDNWNITGPRSVYAFDVVDGVYLTGKRVIYKAQSLAPDGMKVAKNGYVLAATGSGVDILDSYGTYIARIQTNFTVNNFGWAGEDYRQIWMTGVGGIGRAILDLPGQGN